MAAQVAFYFDNDGIQRAIEPGDTDSSFTWSDPNVLIASQLAAFVDTGGTLPVLQTGHTGIIPLPSAAWMGLGLLGILAAARRRRRTR